MKKIVLLILFMFLPIFVNADTFSLGVENANRYMSTPTYSKTYERYLVHGNNIPFDYSLTSGVLYNPLFVKGGFISKYEYDNTVLSNQSYLYGGLKYWTSTGEENSKYVVGLPSMVDINSSYSSRVTEFVEHDTKVTGKGSFEDPWVFVPKFKVYFYTDNYELGMVNQAISDEYYYRGDSATAEIIPRLGQYSTNSCNAVYKDNKLVLYNVNKDIYCKVLFEKKVIKITLDEESSGIEPRYMYLIYNEDYYQNLEANIVMNRITSWPTSNGGYTFDGLETSDGTNIKIINRDGTIDKSTIDKIESDTTLRIKWVDETSPTCSVTKTSTGNTGGVNVSIGCSDNGSGCSSNNITSESGLTSNKTYTVYDNAGNSGTCSVSIESYNCNGYDCQPYNCNPYKCCTTKNGYKCEGNHTSDCGPNSYAGHGTTCTSCTYKECKTCYNTCYKKCYKTCYK